MDSVTPTAMKMRGKVSPAVFRAVIYIVAFVYRRDRDEFRNARLAYRVGKAWQRQEVLVCILRYNFAHEAGALGTRHSPHPLWAEGSLQNSGAIRAAGMRSRIWPSLRASGSARSAAG